MIDHSQFTIDQSVTIIGTGSLGSNLARALDEKGIEVFSLFNRSSKSLASLVKEINPTHSGEFPENFDQFGDVIFITTSDNAISKVAKRLSKFNDKYYNKTIVHCSGTKSSSVLSSLQKQGARVAAFHPIQTFNKHSKPNALNNIYFDVEGDDRAINLLYKLANILNSNVLEITPRAKPYLHAAAVVASNYLFALLEMTAEIGEMGGIDRDRSIQALLPLVRQTVENASMTPNMEEALSGPIVRGDVETVKKHLNLLQSNPELYGLYKKLGQQTLKVTEKKKGDEREKLYKLLRT